MPQVCVQNARHVRENVHALLGGEADCAAFIDYANIEIEHFRKEVLGGKKMGKGGNGAKT